MATKTTPKFDFGKFDFSKVDVEQVLAMHKANLGTMFEAQRVMLDTAQTLAAAQFNYFRDALGNAESMATKMDMQAKPEAYAEETKAVAEKAMAVAKNGYDLSLKAQNDVAEILSKRVNANVEEMKKFAA